MTLSELTSTITNIESLSTLLLNRFLLKSLFLIFGKNLFCLLDQKRIALNSQITSLENQVFILLNQVRIQMSIINLEMNLLPDIPSGEATISCPVCENSITASAGIPSEIGELRYNFRDAYGELVSPLLDIISGIEKNIKKYRKISNDINKVLDEYGVCPVCGQELTCY